MKPEVPKKRKQPILELSNIVLTAYVICHFKSICIKKIEKFSCLKMFKNDPVRASHVKKGNTMRFYQLEISFIL